MALEHNIVIKLARGEIAGVVLHALVELHLFFAAQLLGRLLLAIVVRRRRASSGTSGRRSATAVAVHVLHLARSSDRVDCAMRDG